MRMLDLFRAELRRQLMISLRYPLETLAAMAILIGLFYGAIKGISLLPGGDQALTPDALNMSLLGYLCWIVALGSAVTIAADVQNESELGLIEITFSAAFSAEAIYAARILANALIGAVTIVPVIGCLVWLLDADLRLSAIALVPGLLLMAAGCGIGYAYGGIALVFKRVQLLVMPIQLGALALFLAPLPADRSGFFSEAALLPGLPAVVLLRRINAGDHRLDVPLTMTAAANALAYLCVGLLIFRYCLTLARAKGSIGKY